MYIITWDNLHGNHGIEAVFYDKDRAIQRLYETAYGDEGFVLPTKDGDAIITNERCDKCYKRLPPTNMIYSCECDRCKSLESSPNECLKYTDELAWICDKCRSYLICKACFVSSNVEHHCDDNKYNEYKEVVKTANEELQTEGYWVCGEQNEYRIFKCKVEDLMECDSD